ncbi:hypothetical protein F4810DRAFT_706114 [Camillea tinctor]|nr:hypothetical protein F4810DRAFT_706114 [Camillea tinctor]
MSSLCRISPLQAGISLLARPHLRSSLGTSRIFFPPLPKSRCHGSRAFHTPAIISVIIQETPDLLISIHTATHTPWFLTIPLIALGVNLICRLPCTIYTQKVIQRRLQCTTLLRAWTTRIQVEVLRSGLDPSRRDAEANRRLKEVIRRVYSRLGLQEWKLWTNVLTLPFWLVAIDGIRRLCGGPRGLLGLLSTQSSDTSPGPTTGTWASSEDTSTTSLMEADSVSSVHPVDPSAASGVSEAFGQVIDPSLITEGCLWFSDLTAADPYHILPYLLSASIAWNIFPRSKEQTRFLFGLQPMQKQGTDVVPKLKPTAQLRIRRAMLMMAVCVGPATANLPAAVHLYWLSSSLASGTIVAIVKRLIPTKPEMYEKYDVCKNTELPIIRVQQQRKSPSKLQQQQKTKGSTK